MRVISITPTGALGTRRRTISPALKIGDVSVKFLTIVILSVLAMFYLIQSQLSTNKNQEIKSLQTQKEDLVKQSEDLQIQSNQFKSITGIEESAQKMGMVQVTNVTYAGK